MRFVLLVLTLHQPAGTALGWSESGHHLIALYAFDAMGRPERDLLLSLLERHPRYAEDFSVPANATDTPRWLVGRAGYWPDVARRSPAYNRPTWHYQLAATLEIGEGCRVPETPGILPLGSNLDTRSLHIAQAMELCRGMMSDPKQSLTNRAIAACWIAHLVGDAHQPCHAGSLYCEGVFPDGDRGANEIRVRQGRNLHALWDGLLGRRFDEGDIKRRLRIVSDLNLPADADSTDLDPMAWLAESREYARAVVYTPEVLGPVRAVHEGKLDELPTITLSEEYLQRAGAAARIRARQAGERLAKIWLSGMTERPARTNLD